MIQYSRLNSDRGYSLGNDGVSRSSLRPSIVVKIGYHTFWNFSSSVLVNLHISIWFALRGAQVSAPVNCAECRSTI